MLYCVSFNKSPNLSVPQSNKNGNIYFADVVLDFENKQTSKQTNVGSGFALRITDTQQILIFPEARPLAPCPGTEEC